MNVRLTSFLLIIIAATGITFQYYYFPVYKYKFYPECVLYSVTGLYCPACGSQRAFSSLLHGHFLQALHYNLLFVIGLIILTIIGIRWLINSILTRELIIRIKVSSFVLWVILVVVLLFWILRNIHGYPFEVLAPARGS
ncbi:MAG: DUF2752 domain-containing protein [Flavisolibacter sp.]